MRIANPIYDVVFSFMMEDKRVAKTFISAIIGEEIVELDSVASKCISVAAGGGCTKILSGRTAKNKAENSKSSPSCWTVFWFDYLAKIALPDGEYKTVLIEVQKAKFQSDIMGSRRYTNRQPDNTYEVNGETKTCPIYYIFLLGDDVLLRDHPVIRIDSSIEDVATSEVVDSKNDFIQSLNPRSWIVQISQLRKPPLNDLDKLLSIFDQKNRARYGYAIDVEENEDDENDDFPAIYRPILRRLRMAYDSDGMQIAMEMENDYLKELQDKERLRYKKDKAIEEMDKAIEETDKAIEEQRKINEEQRNAFEELKKQPS